MQLALAQAQLAAQRSEVPVGAVIVCDDELVAAAYNQPVASHDPSAHAEINALRQAAQVKNNYRLPGCTLYVTIEPCTMCVGALIHARVDVLVFGAREPRAGAVVSQQQLLKQDFWNHKLEFHEGILADECAALMQTFFRQKRGP